MSRRIDGKHHWLCGKTRWLHSYGHTREGGKLLECFTEPDWLTIGLDGLWWALVVAFFAWALFGGKP